VCDALATDAPGSGALSVYLVRMAARVESGAVAIEFRDTVKAQITQAVLSALLERCGYRVTRLGIEELFGEVKFKELAQYRELELPVQLRYLPDLLVASLDENKAFLVEVKFRRCFDERAARSLFAAIERQRQHWPESHAVLMIAEPFVVEGKFHQDYIRVLPPHETGRLVDKSLAPRRRWERMPRLQGVFKAFSAPGTNQALADFVTLALKSLAGL
jgi:hypothetical protein